MIRFHVIGLTRDRRNSWQLAAHEAIETARANAQGAALAARLELQDEPIVSRWQKAVRNNVLGFKRARAS